MSLRRRRDPQYLTLTTTKNGTFTASITKIAGAPDCVWKFEDGEEQVGDSCSKVLDGHEQKVVLKIAPKLIATLGADDQDVTALDNARRCANMSSISCQINRELAFSLFDLNKNIDSVNFVIGLHTVGNISHFASARTIALGACPLIDGDLADLPSVVEYVDLSGCVLITGYEVGRLHSIYDIRLHNQTANQDRVDAIILDIWQHRADFTYAGCITCNLDGNNAAPSGNVTEPEEGTDWHLDGETWIPLTSGAKVFDLVNDVNSEGFNLWSITVT